MDRARIARIERARDFIDEIKVTNPCTRCGKVPIAPEQMMFVEKPGVAAGCPIGRLLCSGASTKRLAAEMLNRDLVCTTCAPKRKIKRLAMGTTPVEKPPKPKKLTPYEEQIAELRRVAAITHVVCRNSKLYDDRTGKELTLAQVVRREKFMIDTDEEEDVPQARPEDK